MCLIFLSYHHHSDYPLIVAANRDEYYSRPSEAIHTWLGSPEITAGKDLQKGGTWLGISNSGRFAAVTNVRSGSPDETRKSRGQLTLDLLTTNKSEQLLSANGAVLTDYNDLNCLYYDERALYYLTNKSTPGVIKLTPGIYGLSNASLDTPWPKVSSGKDEFRAAIQGKPDEEALWTMLNDRQIAADKDLPDTGVSLEWERRLSSKFIQSPHYGTRSSLLMFWSNNGTVELKERRYDAGGYAGESSMTTSVLSA